MVEVLHEQYLPHQSPYGILLICKETRTQKNNDSNQTLSELRNGIIKSFPKLAESCRKSSTDVKLNSTPKNNQVKLNFVERRLQDFCKEA